jgi:hypothetical protein
MSSNIRLLIVSNESDSPQITWQLTDGYLKMIQIKGMKRSLGKSACGNKVKVKVTLVQALRLCRGRTAHKGSRGIALL